MHETSTHTHEHTSLSVSVPLSLTLCLFSLSLTHTGGGGQELSCIRIKRIRKDVYLRIKQINVLKTLNSVAGTEQEPSAVGIRALGCGSFSFLCLASQGTG